MSEVDNRMVIDEQWADMEKEPEYERGYFTRYGTFVNEEYILEVAMEDVQNDSFLKDSFIEEVLDCIEKDKEATEKFLKWFYPDYGEEN